jgi:predicted MPP superfamily phosphohydrolase
MLKRFSSWRERANITYRQTFQLTLAELMRILGRDRFRPQDFTIKPLDVDIGGLDPKFDGYRIVHISDMHLGHWLSVERLAGVVELVNQQEPDLIAITGDFVSYVFDELVDDMVKLYSRLKAVDGVVAVLGNHDHWMDPENIRPVLKQSHIVELENDVFTLQRDQAVLFIAGVDDIMVGADRLDLVLEKLPPDGPAILLAHEPDFADDSAATGRFALQLSGHSHGGQIDLPGIRKLIRGPHFKKYIYGRYQVGDMVQYTNPGLGTHVFRLRINVPPEITVITLHSK